MENKSLRDISWNVDEATYRVDNALSYSILAKYEREGFNNLYKLFERVESPSLLFGSIVDTMITGDANEFNDKYMVAQLNNSLSDILINITKTLYKVFKDDYSDIKDIPENKIIETITGITWNNHWKPKTRVDKIKEECRGYYKLLFEAKNKTIVDYKLYQEAIMCVDVLKYSEATKFYFAEDSIFNTNIQRFYQLKFKSTFNDIDYRCMADELIVLHDKKIIIPIDLKTSSKNEWDFYKSFIEWNYPIQARLYWRIIRDNLDKDPYFKDFELLDYRFIVVNRNSLIPLVWEFKGTQEKGELKYGKNQQIILRDPFTIGEELTKYLRESCKVPEGINIYQPNILEDWINKL